MTWGEGGNIWFLTPDERQAVLWAIRLGLQYDDGFSFPRDQNREILRSARNRLLLQSEIEAERLAETMLAPHAPREEGDDRG